MKLRLKYFIAQYIVHGKIEKRKMYNRYILSFLRYFCLSFMRSISKERNMVYYILTLNIWKFELRLLGTKLPHEQKIIWDENGNSSYVLLTKDRYDA